MIENKKNRETFIKSARSFMKEYKLDGIGISDPCPLCTFINGFSRRHRFWFVTFSILQAHPEAILSEYPGAIERNAPASGAF
jgi:hypothetical protein